MSEANWFFARFGQQHGPMTLDDLRGQAAAGAFQREDLVWREGMADWLAAGQVPEVADAFVATPTDAPYDLSPEQASQAPAGYSDPYAAAYPGVAQLGGVLSYGTYQSHIGSQQVRLAGTLVVYK